MKYLVFIMCMYTHHTHAQSNILVSQSIHDINRNTLIFSIDTTFYDVEFIPTANNYITVETSVTSNTGSKSVLNYLNTQGRYTINVYQHDKFHATVLYLNHDKKDIFINGQSIHESYKFTIRVPSEMKCKVRKPRESSIANT